MKYIILCAAAVAASPASIDTSYYVPGNLPFERNIHAMESNWEYNADYYLTIGINACPGMSQGEAAVFINRTFTDRAITPDWKCLNLITGSLSAKGSKPVATTECDYIPTLSMFVREAALFKDAAPSFVSYMSVFSTGWVQKSKGLICQLQTYRLTASGQLTPTTFIAKALGDDTTEVVAELVAQDGKVLASDRVALKNSPASEQDIKFSTNVTGLFGVQTTLQYGIVSKGAPLSQAIYKYTTPYYFTRPDVLNVKQAKFIRGHTGKVIINYEFDFDHALTAHIKEPYELLAFGPASKSVERLSIRAPKGKGSVELITRARLDPKKYQSGKNYTIVMYDQGFYAGERLDQPIYPGFEFTVTME